MISWGGVASVQFARVRVRDRVFGGIAISDAYRVVGMISHWDLGEKKPSLQELVEMARQFNRTAGTGFLARLNLYLSLAQQSHDANKGLAVQARLTEEVLSETRLKQFREVFAGKKLYEDFILLNRAQLLGGNQIGSTLRSR